MGDELASNYQEFVNSKIKWNQSLRASRGISESAKNLNIDPHNIVFVGGIAVFLHANDVLGNQTFNNWRGTDDVDFVFAVRYKNPRNDLFEKLEIFYSGTEILREEKTPFPNKERWTIFNKSKGFMEGGNSDTQIDLYYLDDESGVAQLNNRKFNPFPNNFISEPVTVTKFLDIKENPVLDVAIPSVKDCLILKLDVECKNGKYRDKDLYDILTLLMVAEKKNDENSYNLLSNVINDHINETKQNKTRRLLAEALTNVIKDYDKGYLYPESKMFLPSKEYLIKTREKLECKSIGLVKK